MNPEQKMLRDEMLLASMFAVNRLPDHLRAAVHLEYGLDDRDDKGRMMLRSVLGGSHVRRLAAAIEKLRRVLSVTSPAQDEHKP